MKKRFSLIFNLRTLFVFASVFAAGYLLSSQQMRAQQVRPPEPITSVRPVVAGELTDNDLAPDVELEKLEGGTVKLSEYRGKWVFLNFWATWCPPCIYEMPAMEKFYQKFKSKNLVMLAVSVDDRNAKQAVIDFVLERKLTFDIFLDTESIAMKKFRTVSLPSTYIINPEGYVVSQAMGARDWMDPTVIEYFAGLMSIDKKEVL